MGRPFGGKNKKHKQFCIHGHDIFICGRTKKGMCNDCEKIRSKKRKINKQSFGYINKLKRAKEKRKIFRLEHPLEKIQFCPKGHNTFIVGRAKNGRCLECKRLEHYESYQPVEVDKRIKPICSDGHDISIVGRYKNGKCKSCTDIRTVEYQKKHPEKNKIRTQRYYEGHREDLLAKQKQWKKEHPELVSASRIKHQTNRQLRIVTWTDWPEINKFERNKPKGMTTDHIIPLQNKLVWGLHVSWNMQYLTKSENSKKKNKVNLLEASEWYGKILKEAGLK